MKTTREEELVQALKECRHQLREIKQKNADLQKSKEKYKTANKELRRTIGDQRQELKKNSRIISFPTSHRTS